MGRVELKLRHRSTGWMNVDECFDLVDRKGSVKGELYHHKWAGWCGKLWIDGAENFDNLPSKDVALSILTDEYNRCRDEIYRDLA